MSNYISFIEDKAINWNRVHEFLDTSKEENHWTNFGPVSQQLERYIHQLLELSKKSSVITTSSCTAALDALSQSVQFVIGRKPRWVVSSFGFFSTHRNEFRDSLIIDCEDNGMLSIQDLKNIPDNDWDGVVVTNVFGLCNDVDKYIEYAALKNKFIIIDNAAGLTSLPIRCNSEKIMYTVSFHHTKAFGFGEGGCAIVHSDLKETVKTVTNYGVALNDNEQYLGFNGKISDLACAFILQRLEDEALWSPEYIEQSLRIRDIAHQVGLRSLIENYNAKLSIPSQLPFLSQNPIFSYDLDNKYFKLRKYYKPHNKKSPTANKIYSHIVNVPCHPEMASLSDRDIASVLQNLVSV